jgi:hypothetical protein
MKNATPRFNPEVPSLSLQYRMASRLPRVIRRGFGLQLEGGADLSPEADKRLEGAGKLFKTSKRVPVDGNRPNLKNCTSGPVSVSQLCQMDHHITSIHAFDE